MYTVHTQHMCEIWLHHCLPQAVCSIDGLWHRCALQSLQNAAQRALFALQARCAELGILDPKLKCKLYDAAVRPVRSYGCEVWMRLISSSGINKRRRSSWTSCVGLWAYQGQQLQSTSTLRVGGCQTAHSGGSKAFDTCTTSQH